MTRFTRAAWAWIAILASILAGGGPEAFGAGRPTRP